MRIDEKKSAVIRTLRMIDDGHIDIISGCKEDAFLVGFIEDAVRKYYSDVFGEDPE